MSTLTHAQYNSPMPLYSHDNVQDVIGQVTGYPGRSQSALSGGSFDPSQSHVARYLQTGGHLPAAHSARYDELRGNEPAPKYRGFVDPNVQSPSFKRLQYVTGVDSGAEDEISREMAPPPQNVQSGGRQGGGAQQQGQGQPIALGYAPISGGQSQQQQYDQQYQQQQYDRSQWTEAGPPVAQRDPTAETERDHALDPTFAVRIAEAERPKVPPPVVPSWARYAERKQERWQTQPGQQAQQPRSTVQYYRPPQSSQQLTPQWTLDSSKTAQDKWQAHYAPYRFETGATAASQERPRSRSAEPGWVSGRRYGGSKEWMKPFIAPSLRFNYGNGFGPPAQPSYSPLSAGRTYNISTKQQDYSQYGSQTAGGTGQYGQGVGGTGQYGSQGVGGGVGGTSPYYGTGTQTYSSLSQNQQSRSQQDYGSAYAPQGGRSTSAYDYTSTTTQGGLGAGLGGTGTSGTVGQTGQAPSWAKDAQSQYSRTVYESQSRKEGGTGSTYQPQQGATAPYTGSQSTRTDTRSQNFLESESEAKRQRQLMEQEVMRRAASAGPPAGRQGQGGTTTTTVSSGPAYRQGGQQDNRVTTYTTTTGATAGQKWQQAPGSETKTASSGEYLDPQGNKVTFTKEVYTSSDPGKEFSMLTEQEKKILEEPLQPGVVSRHITTKYYKKSTFTSSTTTSTSQTPPVTTTTRQAITSGPRQY